MAVWRQSQALGPPAARPYARRPAAISATPGSPGRPHAVRRVHGLAGALAQRLHGRRGHRREDRRQRAREGRRPPPPLVERRGRASLRTSSPTRTSASPASTKRSRSRSASPSANGPGTPGGGTGDRSAALTASITRPATGCARRPPDGDRDAAARAQHRRIAARAGRVDREHQPLAAQHDVVGAVGLVDAVDVERARARLRQAAVAARAAAIAVISSATSVEHDLAAGPTRSAAASPSPPGPHASSSDPVAGPDLGQREHPVRALRAARVGVVGVFGPPRRRPRPHAGEPRAQRGPLVRLLHDDRLAVMSFAPVVVFTTRCMY